METCDAKHILNDSGKCACDNSRKFYRTLIQVEILTEDEPFSDPENLDTVHYEITEGHASGSVKLLSVEEKNGKEMASLLQGQGSDPEFFRLDADGKELPE